MKLLLLFLLFQTITLSANENWISIANLNKAPTSKPSSKLDVNLSQIEPIKKMIKNVKVVKQLIDITTKEEISVANEKNWFMLNSNEK